MHETGMPAIETIQASTVKAADLIGVSDILGTIEKGKLADIIAVDGDPLTDLHVMGKVKFVMRNGVAYKSE